MQNNNLLFDETSTTEMLGRTNNSALLRPCLERDAKSLKIQFAGRHFTQHLFQPSTYFNLNSFCIEFTISFQKYCSTCFHLYILF